MTTNLTQPAHSDGAEEKKVSLKTPLSPFSVVKADIEPTTRKSLQSVNLRDIPDDYRPPTPYMRCGIEPNSWTILFAPKKSMKSFFQFQVSVALATGRDAFADAPRFENMRKRRVRVLLISSEMDGYDLQRRHGTRWKQDIFDDELKLPNGEPLDWLRLVVRPPITKETLHLQRTDPYEDILEHLDAGIAEGYPFEVVQIDNLTTIWPAELSDQTLSANLNEKMLSLCARADYGVALMTSMHLNKTTEYNKVNFGYIKGNELFGVNVHNIIGMNRSRNRANGAYLVEQDSRWQDETRQHHRNNVATFTVYPEVDGDANSPLTMVFEGTDTEASQSEGSEGRISDLKRIVQGVLKTAPHLTYEEMKAELQQQKQPYENLRKSSYNNWRREYWKGAGIEGRTDKLKFSEDATSR